MLIQRNFLSVIILFIVLLIKDYYPFNKMLNQDFIQGNVLYDENSFVRRGIHWFYFVVHSYHFITYEDG